MTSHDCAGRVPLKLSDRGECKVSLECAVSIQKHDETSGRPARENLCRAFIPAPRGAERTRWIKPDNRNAERLGDLTAAIA